MLSLVDQNIEIPSPAILHHVENRKKIWISSQLVEGSCIDRILLLLHKLNVQVHSLSSSLRFVYTESRSNSKYSCAFRFVCAFFWIHRHGCICSW